MKFNTDVDIDVADRDQILRLIKHVPAAMRKLDPIRKHASGIYVSSVPYDPVHDMAAIDYSDAEERGYFKLDLLNMHVYSQVKDENHLTRLMQEPDWTMLNKREIVENLVHLNNSFNYIQRMPEPINSIPRLAMFLAAIRPSKKHLIGKTWSEIAKTIWDKDADGYAFKRSHSVSYAQLVIVHMNLLKEQENAKSS